MKRTVSVCGLDWLAPVGHGTCVTASVLRDDVCSSMDGKIRVHARAKLLVYRIDLSVLTTCRSCPSARQGYL
jgi:acyl dehydratase